MIITSYLPDLLGGFFFLGDGFVQIGLFNTDMIVRGHVQFGCGLGLKRGKA